MLTLAVLQISRLHFGSFSPSSVDYGATSDNDSNMIGLPFILGGIGGITGKIHLVLYLDFNQYLKHD